MPVTIVPLTHEYLRAAVEVHLRSFPGFFLTFLGPRFLHLLYAEILKAPHHVAFAALAEQSTVIGFVVGVEDQTSLYTRMIRRRLFSFAVASLRAVVEKPAIVGRLLRALWYPHLSREAACPALLMSVAVVPEAKGQGIGRLLVDRFVGEMGRRGIDKVSLLTDRDNNDKVNDFYRGVGFTLVRSFVTKEQRWMNEYLISTSRMDTGEGGAGKANSVELRGDGPARPGMRGPDPGTTNGRTENFREAGRENWREIAALHYACAKVQPGGFLYKLGMPFFCAYYRILLADPNTFVLYAVDTQRNVVGLVAGCYNARVEAKLLRKKTASLLLPCIPRLLRQPSLVRSLYMRKSGLDGSTSGPWSFNEDPRISFWGWSPEASSEGQSTALLARYMELLKLRGFSRVRFEVDRVNRKAELVHRLMGATLVAKVDAFDGRERLIMEHVL